MSLIMILFPFYESIYFKCTMAIALQSFSRAGALERLHSTLTSPELPPTAASAGYGTHLCQHQLLAVVKQQNGTS